MPLLLQREAAPRTQLAIWKIEEPADWFRAQLILDERENALIDSFRNEKRKLHWLSSRLLLRRVMNVSEFIHLESDSHGRPVVHNFPVKISISHSADLSALLMSEEYDVGIDIEQMDEKIFRVQHKFMSEKELASVHKHLLTPHLSVGLKDASRLAELYVHWCAKETMYKCYGKKELEFKKNLLLNSFELSPEGEIEGRVTKQEEIVFPIHYEQLGDYMLAYTFKKL